MDEKQLTDLLQDIRTVRTAVVGDVCLDAYWFVKMENGELSRETPHFTRPVVRERYSGGALGNVAQNCRALGIQKVSVYTILGSDWRGRKLVDILKDQQIDTNHIQHAEDRFTPTYLKPILMGLESEQEAERIDFVNLSDPVEETVEALCRELENGIDQLDCVVVGDQVSHGVCTEHLISRISQLALNCRKVVFSADSRTRIEKFQHLAWKPNELEALKALGLDQMPEENLRSNRKEIAEQLLAGGCRLVFLTLGEDGCMVAQNGRTVLVPGVKAPPPVDIVGAGDSFHAAAAAALAAGASAQDAAFLGNLAASATVRKIGTTGTAAPEEIISIFREREAQCGS